MFVYSPLHRQHIASTLMHGLKFVVGKVAPD